MLEENTEENAEIIRAIWRNVARNLLWFAVYVLLTGILFNGAVALVVLTVERLRRLRAIRTTAMGGTPTKKEKMKPRDLDGT